MQDRLFIGRKYKWDREESRSYVSQEQRFWDTRKYREGEAHVHVSQVLSEINYIFTSCLMLWV